MLRRTITVLSAAQKKALIDDLHLCVAQKTKSQRFPI